MCGWQKILLRRYSLKSNTNFYLSLKFYIKERISFYKLDALHQYLVGLQAKQDPLITILAAWLNQEERKQNIFMSAIIRIDYFRKMLKAECKKLLKKTITFIFSHKKSI